MTRAATRYDYKAVAAPRRPGRWKGVAKGAESYARTLEELLAAEAVDGWEYLRAESLPSEEKTGWLARRSTVIHSVLIFRRLRGGAGAAETSPDSAVMRLDPEMREPEPRHPAETGPRLGPADG